MNDGLEIIPPGRRVWVGLPTLSQENTGVEGVVLEVLVRRNKHPQYRVAWWDGRTRKDEWLDDAEVQPKLTGTPSRERIGFRLESK